MDQPGGESPDKRPARPPGPGRRLGATHAMNEAARRAHFFQLSRDLLAITDRHGRLLDLNHAWTMSLGLRLGDLVRSSLADLAHPEDQPLVEARLALLAGGADSVTLEARVCAADGGYRRVVWQISRDRRSDLLYAVGQDVTGRRQIEAELCESEQRFQQLLATATHTIWVLDLREQRVVFANHEEFCGYGRDELGPELARAIHQADRPAVLARFRRVTTAAAGDASYDEGEYRFWRRDGRLEWVHSRAAVLSRAADGRPRQVAFTFTVITDHKHFEQLLDYQARYDLVTGLPNRFSFADRLEEHIALAQARGERFALCVFDLDRFNQINDSLGHTAGDDVLAQLAFRLRRAIGADDVLARMGGDEFTLIMAHAHSAEEASRAAHGLLGLIEEPILLEGNELFISASVGISLYPNDATDATTLLRHADSAMYRSKAVGRNSVTWFVPELGHATVARLELGNQLRRAIDQQQFELHYQPQVSFVSGLVVGVEALLRWRHPERGLVPSAEFIALAEESHLMGRISAWVLDEACRQAAAWQRVGLPPLRVAVNISARQFEREDMVQRTAAALRQAGLDPRWLDLEITESVLMRDPEGSSARIVQLRAMGVRVSIDDFGTGYSSLAYLQRFPLDALKIDRSFVGAISDEQASRPASLVQAIIVLAHSLGLVVVAEGVETTAQHRLLRSLGCDEAQGYLFAEPMTPGQVWDSIRALRQTLGPLNH